MARLDDILGTNSEQKDTPIMSENEYLELLRLRKKVKALTSGKEMPSRSETPKTESLSDESKTWFSEELTKIIANQTEIVTQNVALKGELESNKSEIARLSSDIEVLSGERDEVYKQNEEIRALNLSAANRIVENDNKIKELKKTIEELKDWNSKCKYARESTNENPTIYRVPASLRSYRIRVRYNSVTQHWVLEKM